MTSVSMIFWDEAPLLALFDCGLGRWHIAIGQNGTQSGSRHVDEQKFDYLDKTLALIRTQYDFHAITSFSITLHPMRRFERGSLTDAEEILHPSDSRWLYQ